MFGFYWLINRGVFHFITLPFIIISAAFAALLAITAVLVIKALKRENDHDDE